MIYIPDEFDFTLKVGDDYQPKSKNKVTHNLKMVFGLAVLFLTGAFTAYHGGFNYTDVITMLVAGLLAIQHAKDGNTTS